MFMRINIVGKCKQYFIFLLCFKKQGVATGDCAWQHRDELNSIAERMLVLHKLGRSWRDHADSGRERCVENYSKERCFAA
jgi:hypothetical protein